MLEETAFKALLQVLHFTMLEAVVVVVRLEAVLENAIVNCPMRQGAGSKEEQAPVMPCMHAYIHAGNSNHVVCMHACIDA